MIVYGSETNVTTGETRTVEIEIAPHVKSVEELKSEIESAIQNMLDTKAQSKGYDSILSATSYAGYPNDFQLEGVAFGAWRANVWKYCYQQLAEIESGERPIIPTVEEFIAELPTL